MTSTDPIADYLTRVRNAISAGHKKVDVPASNVKRALTDILRDYKFINGYSEVKETLPSTLRIQLKYVDGENVIRGLKRVSTPGKRVYVSSNELPRVLNGLGIAIISTSSGILTDRQAREKHVGGEVMCYIW